MIEWKEYGQTRDTQPPSHVPYLITNRKFVVIGVHQIGKDRVYRWYTDKGQPIAGVTHYAEINFPQANGTTESDRIRLAEGGGRERSVRARNL